MNARNVSALATAINVCVFSLYACSWLFQGDPFAPVAMICSAMLVAASAHSLWLYRKETA